MENEFQIIMKKERTIPPYIKGHFQITSEGVSISTRVVIPR